MTDNTTEANDVIIDEQALFDRLVTVEEEILERTSDIKQLKKDAKFNKKTNPNGLSREEIVTIAAAAKLRAKKNFEEFTGKAFAVRETYKRLTGYDD